MGSHPITADSETLRGITETPPLTRAKVAPKAEEFKASKTFLKIITPFIHDTEAQYSGYDICKRTNLRTGVVYPMLYTLLAKSWLSVEWEKTSASDRSGPRRKLYKITSEGAKNGRKLINDEYPFLRGALLAEPT